MTNFPFSALVGQEQLKTALLLNAVDSGIGGVLVCGEKGTAKSTAGRALADLLPPIAAVPGCPFNSPPDDPFYGLEEVAPASGAGQTQRGRACQPSQTEGPSSIEIPVPFVELPLGATEDRVLGTLDIQRALRDGERAFHPGLLARANRGILYIDEVNLLPDHLVDLLLDAAAMGVNTVQREGIEFVHPARFLLIGTMNPEEGELRPQLLDRFGLMVQVDGPSDPETRVDVVRRRSAFDADAAAFLSRWQPAQDELRDTITTARQLLPDVVTDDELLMRISQICCQVGVSGMRADLVMHKTARALAAFSGRTTVTETDVRQAAELVLPHRRRRQPFERPGWDRNQLDELLPPDDNEPDERRQPDEAHPEEHASPSQADTSPSADTSPDDNRDDAEPLNDNDNEPDGEGSGRPEPRVNTFPAASPDPIQPFQVAPGKPRERRTPGRRNKSANQGSGRHVRSVRDQSPTELAVDATVRSAAGRGRGNNGRPDIQPSDLHQKERAGPAETLILFVVDASGSMAARRRMEAVKGAVLSLLVDAYQKRDRVGVIVFRGQQAELLLPPTGSVELAERTLQSLPTGGRTPLAHALMLATQTVRQTRRRDPEQLVLTVLLTDGKANVPLPEPTGEPWQQTLEAAGGLASEGVHVLLLDTDTGFVRLDRARVLAGALSAEHRRLEDLSAESLTLEVRQRTGGLARSASPLGGPA